MVNEVQAGSYNALLHKLLSMKEGAPAPTLAPELISSLCLENDRPEWGFLKGERLLSGRGQLATATTGLIVLFNPVGSGVLAVVHRAVGIFDTLAIANRVIWTVTQTAPTTPNIFAGIPRDLRLITLGTQLSACQIGTHALGNHFVIQDNLASRSSATAIGATAEAHLEVPVVLPPGSGLGFGQNAVANLTLVASFHWTERALDPSETR